MVLVFVMVLASRRVHSGTTCGCACACVCAWSCAGMRVRVLVNSTVPPCPKVYHLDIVGIRRTSARTCALHFYIKLLKMVSNTRCDINQLVFWSVFWSSRIHSRILSQKFLLTLNVYVVVLSIISTTSELYPAPLCLGLYTKVDI